MLQYFLITNKKATMQKCTVAKKTQTWTSKRLQAHFEKRWIFDHVWLLLHDHLKYVFSLGNLTLLHPTALKCFDIFRKTYGCAAL